MPTRAKDASQNSITCRYQALLIELEPLEVEEQVGSVQLAIRIAYEGKRQSLHWTGKMWISYAALTEFEEALRAHEVATLVDMSLYPVLQIAAVGGQVHVMINPKAERQALDGERLTVKLQAEPGLPSALAMAFRDFPKWW
jgi:hypothetical protein